MNSNHRVLLVLLALLLPALFVGLGERPVSKIQEVRIAETAREMLVSGDWVVPRYNGELRLQKPPLPYWLTAASYRILGVSEFSTRLPAVLFGLLAAVLVWSWVRRESGLGIAGNCVLLIVISYIGLRYFRSGEADSELLFFITGANLLGYDILQGRGNSRRRLLFGMALGLGFLSKGPAALAIPVLTLAVAGVIEKRAGRQQPAVRDFFSWPGLAALLLAAFGWYVWIVWQLPDSAQYFFGKQLDETFVSGTHAKPVWWYLVHWFEFFAPWGVVLIPAGTMAYRQRDSAMLPLLRFAWIWLAIVFILLTATVNKQMQYALLLAPPLAIILGHYLAQAQGGYARTNRILFWVFIIAISAGIVAALRVSSAPSHAPIWFLLPLAPLILHRLFRVGDLSAPVLLVAGMTSMAYLYSDSHLSKEPRRIAAQILMSEAAQYTPLYQPRTPLNDGALSFYAGRVVSPVGTDEIAMLLQEQPEIWLVGETMPESSEFALHVVREIGDLKLCRITRKP